MYLQQKEVGGKLQQISQVRGQTLTSGIPPWRAGPPHKRDWYRLDHSSTVESFQSCLTLNHPIGCSPPGSSVHGILQARILEWVAMPSSRGSSQPRDRTHIPCIAGRFLTTEPPGKPRLMYSSPIHSFIYFNVLCLQRNPLSSCNRWKVVFKENNLTVIMIFFILFYLHIYLSLH